VATETGGLRLVGEAIDKALPAPKVGKIPGGADDQEPELPLLPAGCPVKPLGKLGQVCYFLDEQGQLVGLDPQKMGKNHIRSLFGRKSDLCDEFWPRLDDKGHAKGHGQWHPEIAADVLGKAAACAGIFDPQGRVRGRGAHRGKDGELILHCGDSVYRTGAGHEGYWEPGLIDGFVYPTAPEIPHPDPENVTTAPAEKLLTLLRTWQWARPVVDPMLLLGWIGGAMYGGALHWRPHIWVTGSSATGKSTLQQALELLFDGAALHTHDATEAALRQLLKQQTLPVFFDELEAEEDNRRNSAVIKLARLASSGAVILRGGQDHQGHEFVARSCFMFSSILLPPMLSQDRNRLAILELEALPEGAVPPVLADRELRAWGREIRKRLVDQWPRFEATLHDYRTVLAKHGHGGRSQDQFGTLLACADLLLYDFEPDNDLLEEWGERLAVKTLAEKALDQSDEDEAVHFLATSILQGRGGDEPRPISRHILDALRPEAEAAMDRLENFGLRIVTPTTKGDLVIGARKPVAGDPLYLAVANHHEALAKIFRDKRWSEGVWVQAFQRVKGAHKRVKVRFAGTSTWSTLIPLAAIVDLKPES
jgi:hypothetical protein